MTIKQLLIGSVLGATAVGLMLQRLPKRQPMASPAPAPVAKAVIKATPVVKKEARVVRRPSTKKTTPTRFSLTKVFE